MKIELQFLDGILILVVYLFMGVNEMNSFKFFIGICAIAGISMSVYADELLVTAASSVAVSSVPTTPTITPQKPRLRVIARNGTSVAYYPNSKCEGSKNKVSVTGYGSAFASLFGTINNESIGMPETETTKNLAKNNSVLSKTYYREYQIEAGEPITVAFGYGDTTGAHCDTLANTFVPELGANYEGRLNVNYDAKSCTFVMNRIELDGSLSSVQVVQAATCH